jgi:hypothetical protein
MPTLETLLIFTAAALLMNMLIGSGLYAAQTERAD